MFAEDLDTCKIIAEEQDKNGYYIASGITSKDKIVEKDALLLYNAYANN